MSNQTSAHVPDWGRIAARIADKCVSTAPSACWEWSASTDAFGYGRISFRNENRRACKVSWMAHNKAEWPEGKYALHSCDNRICVNPEHIRPGTNAENVKESWERGGHSKYALRFKTHCLRGHPYTPENTYFVDRPDRTEKRCRACHRSKAKKYNDRRAARKKGLIV